MDSRQIEVVDSFDSFIDAFAEPAAENGAEAEAGANPAGPEARQLALSERAAERLKTHASGQWLRLRILAGGCSGFQALFSLEKEKKTTDLAFAGGLVLTDPASLAVLGEGLIDFEQSLSGQSFVLKPSQAHHACSCGVSFQKT